MRELKLNFDTKSSYIKHINENVLTADLVVWDDIATKNASEFEHEQMLSIIDSRIDNNKSNIFTSNVLPDVLNDYIGARLTSRIIGLSIPIQFKGLDKRGCK
jgi:DNA replication protein DnaC